MARITDLALELLTIIVTFYREPRSSSNKPNNIRNLSLVSRAFNNACAHFLFRYHCLMIRKDRTKFDPAYAKECISVIVRKSSYIRELKIQDWKEDDADVLPDEIMPELVAALNLVKGLVRLTLCSLSLQDEERQVPDALWNWIKEQGSQLKYLHLSGPWLPPAEGAVIDKVDRLILEPLSRGNIPFIKLVKAPNLSASNTLLVPFKPGKDEEHLRSIVVVLYGNNWGDHLQTNELENLLDFSGMPETKVVVELKSMNVGPRTSPFKEWVKVRASVNKILADDLTKFNVLRHKREPYLTVWRIPNVEVRYQDQLDNEEADAKEREEEEARERELERLRILEAENKAAMVPRRIRYRDWS